MEAAAVVGKADRPNVVAEGDGAAQLHQGDVVVEQGVVPAGMDNDLGHGAAHLINIGPTLSLSSKVDVPE